MRWRGSLRYEHGLRRPHGAENVQLDAQILLRILADRLHQVAGLDQHVVSVVVERFVLEEFAGGTLARFQFGSQL